MARIRHLSKAPILEAVFDFRVKPSKKLQGGDFVALLPRLERDFPEMQEQREQKLTFTVNQAQPQPPRLDDFGVLGMLFRSVDGRTQTQLRADGFSVNRLAPYSSWGELLPLIERTWVAYCDLAKPELVVRAAMRYINRIPLPQIPFETDLYLAAGPKIPEELPQDFGSFLSRVTLLDRTRGLSCNVVQAIEQGPENSCSLLLDLDAFARVELGPADEALWTKMGELHTFKNQVFFSYLKDSLLTDLE